MKATAAANPILNGPSKAQILPPRNSNRRRAPAPSGTLRQFAAKQHSVTNWQITDVAASTG
jgi:hypothetical protein